MSDVIQEDIQEELPQEIDQAEEVEAKAEPELPKVSEAETKALTKGWQTKEDWVASGKDADEWISASHFNKNGDIFKQMQTLKAGVKASEQRIADNNEFWKTKLEMEKETLLSQRNEAIEDADVSQVNKLDGQIQKIDAQTAKLEEPEQTVAQEDINAENAYFALLTPMQQAYANQIAKPYLSQGLSGQDLVDAIDTQIKKESPAPETPKNPRRGKAPVTDSKSRSSSVDDGKMTVDNIGKEDKSVLQAMRSMSAKYAKMSNAQLIKVIEDTKL